jgi:DNA invertase Pin-like site-specific DNA recombinase
MKVAIYARVSTKEQSVESQLLPIRDYCLRNDFTVHNEYKDEKVSGAKDLRPQLNLMLRDVREGKFESSIVYKLNNRGKRS